MGWQKLVALQDLCVAELPWRSFCLSPSSSHLNFLRRTRENPEKTHGILKEEVQGELFLCCSYASPIVSERKTLQFAVNHPHNILSSPYVVLPLFPLLKTSQPHRLFEKTSPPPQRPEKSRQKRRRPKNRQSALKRVFWLSVSRVFKYSSFAKPTSVRVPGGDTAQLK